MIDVAAKVKELQNQSDSVSEFAEALVRLTADEQDVVDARAWNCSELPYGELQRIQSGNNGLSLDLLPENQRVDLLSKSISNERPLMVKNEDPQHQFAFAFIPVKQGEQLAALELLIDQPETTDSAPTMELLNVIWQNANDLETSNSSSKGDESQPIQAANVNELDEYVSNISQSLDFKETCYAIANETRKFINCDRVAVLDYKTGKCKAVSISGQPSVNRRANEVRLLAKLSTKVAAIGDQLHYPSDEEYLPQIDQALTGYLAQGVTRSLSVLPVRKKKIQQDELNLDYRHKQNNPVIGCLVLEHFSRTLSEEEFFARSQLASRHAGNTLRAAVNHRSLFLYGIWRMLGKSRIVIAARHLPKTIAVAVALLAIALALIFIRVDFSVSADGVLIPADRRLVFAAENGMIDQVDVKHGDAVDTEKPLIRMINLDLIIEYQKVVDQIETVKSQIDSIDRNKMNRDRLDPTGVQNDPSVERATLEKTLESLVNQLAIYRSRLSSLEVFSPIEGEVITWNVDEKLTERPVVAGHVLLEVANTGGEWVVELNLPDRRIGHLLAARNQQEEPLRITFILAANPNQKFEGRLRKVSNIVEVDSEKGQTVPLVVEFDNSEIDLKQVRSKVTAKIYCGKRSLGYVWLHDLFEFVDKKIFQFF